jgi:TetR/AcrR family transcriptional regulator
MPPTRIRGKNSKTENQSTKELILQAAIDEFAEHGLSGGRVDRIKDRAGVNKQAIYYHFKNKDALFSAALAYCYTQFKVEIKDWSSDISPVDAMHQIIDAIFLNVQRNSNSAALLIDENRNHGRHLKGAVRSTVRSSTARTLEIVREVVTAGQQKGIFRQDTDPDQVYLDIVSSSFFIFDHRHTMREIFGADQTTPQRLSARRQHIAKIIISSLCVEA